MVFYPFYMVFSRPSKKDIVFAGKYLKTYNWTWRNRPPPAAAFPIWVFLFFVGVFQQFRISWSRYSWAGCQDNTAATLYMWKRSCFTTNDAPFPQFSFWSIARRRRRRKKEKETKMESSKSFTIDGKGEKRHTRETWISFPSPKMDNKYPPPCTIWVFLGGGAAQIFLCGFGYLLIEGFLPWAGGHILKKHPVNEESPSVRLRFP